MDNQRRINKRLEEDRVKIRRLIGEGFTNPMIIDMLLLKETSVIAGYIIKQRREMGLCK